MQVLFLLILLIASIVWGLYKAKIKGVVGEKKIAAILYGLNKSRYKVINNLVLTSKGKTAQIDHLVIADAGIFVIETKNYKGWILGSEYSEYWTQSLYKYKNQFYNPIRQNLGHIQALKNLLPVHLPITYISIIVFPAKADIKVKTDTDVIYSYQLLKTIQQYQDANLTEADKDDIFRKISAANKIDTYDKRQHIQSIQENVQRKEQLLKKGICPRCHNELVERQGRFGKFLGCEAYPKCRFTQNI